jgi:hypothetical protein
MNMWDTLHCGSLRSLESLLNVKEHSDPISFHVQATRRKRAKPKNINVKRAAPVETLKPHPSRKK